jgi:hypothetical protein
MPSVSRASDWEDRLRTYFDRVEDEPFRWGTHDCALFTASAISAMCGVDPAEGFRGTYDTQAGAMEALRATGHGTLLKTVKAWLGEPKSVHLAQRGDIVMRDRTTMGVCVGLFSRFVGQEQGQERLIFVPTASCKYAFTVPFRPPAEPEGTA